MVINSRQVILGMTFDFFVRSESHFVYLLMCIVNFHVNEAIKSARMFQLMFALLTDVVTIPPSHRPTVPTTPPKHPYRSIFSLISCCHPPSTPRLRENSQLIDVQGRRVCLRIYLKLNTFMFDCRLSRTSFIIVLIYS